jgi:hypothetical protein
MRGDCDPAPQPRRTTDHENRQSPRNKKNLDKQPRGFTRAMAIAKHRLTFCDHFKKSAESADKRKVVDTAGTDGHGEM